LGKDDSVTSLFVRCGSGRMYDYSFEEVKAAIDIGQENNQGKKYVFYGTFGEFSGKVDERPDPGKFIDQTLELSKYAEEKGADGIVLLVPWALVPNGDETIEDLQVRYYLQVADSVNCPVFIYNTPGMPEGYKLTPSVAARIKHHPNIAGAKISTADMAWVSELELEIQDSHFVLVSGHEGCYLQWLLTGALGVIGQGCNVYTSAIRAILEAFLEGDYGKARAIQFDVIRMLSCFAGYGNSIPGLAYLKSKGLDIQPWDKSGLPLTTEADIRPVVEGIDKILVNYA
ncbi:MAG: dihydrodipicolinate synthase family protein, partial [Candidatus Omnitrophica bacterium]|nr:dihydrodipicolinate synthase family protein [Candidatus Omnitrophota bacterium]